MSTQYQQSANYSQPMYMNGSIPNMYQSGGTANMYSYQNGGFINSMGIDSNVGSFGFKKRLERIDWKKIGRLQGKYKIQQKKKDLKKKLNFRQSYNNLACNMWTSPAILISAPVAVI